MSDVPVFIRDAQQSSWDKTEFSKRLLALCQVFKYTPEPAERFGEWRGLTYGISVIEGMVATGGNCNYQIVCLSSTDGEDNANPLIPDWYIPSNDELHNNLYWMELQCHNVRFIIRVLSEGETNVDLDKFFDYQESVYKKLEEIASTWPAGLSLEEAQKLYQKNPTPGDTTPYHIQYDLENLVVGEEIRLHILKRLILPRPQINVEALPEHLRHLVPQE